MDSNESKKILNDACKSLDEFIEYHSIKKASSQDIIDIVYNAEGDVSEASGKYQKDCAKILGAERFFEIFEVLTDIWNHAPHKSMSGKSPYQIFNETYNAEAESQDDEEQEATVICGDKHMTLKEHEEMIRQMTEVQKPFQKWIDEKFLPEYKEFLSTKFKKRGIEKHHEIARIFFERVLYVGFIRFEEMRLEFVFGEFPHWWQTHIIGMDIPENQIATSLEKALNFIYYEYDMLLDEVS